MRCLYLAAIDNIENVRGKAFNIGGSVDNSLSLIELFSLLEKISNVKIDYKKSNPRISDQRVFISDITSAKKYLGWIPKISKETGLKNMYEWIISKN
jgi:CDP-paratose 2-epimerase